MEARTILRDITHAHLVVAIWTVISHTAIAIQAMEATLSAIAILRLDILSTTATLKLWFLEVMRDIRLAMADITLTIA